MKRLALLLLPLCILIAACNSKAPQNLNYNVTNDALQTGVLDVYVPDNGTYDMAVLVKFLSGNTNKAVTLTLTGLPANVTVSPDTPFIAVPTYTEHFIFTTTGLAVGTYPLTLSSSTPGQPTITYNFNIIVISDNCATLFTGNLNVSNVCTADYTYTATGTAGGTPGILYINNFGGYGPIVNAQVVLDCEKNTLTIPYQTVGNGTTLQGSGTFTQDKMVITYSAVTTPGGPADNCTATFTK